MKKKSNLKRAVFLAITFVMFFSITSVRYSFSAPAWLTSALGVEKNIRADDGPHWDIIIEDLLGCNASQ